MKPVKAYIVNKEEFDTLMNDLWILDEKHENCGGTIKREAILIFMENEKSVEAKRISPQYPMIELAAMRSVVLSAGMCDKCKKFGVGKSKEQMIF